MNSQNRMNAGAEYVLYRIWAALQDPDGIHAESLLTCVGALAGFACQVCVRQTAALPDADPRKYALRTVETRDGTTYLDGDALNVLLVDSPLSLWALVGRAVQKLGKPLPDIDDIFRHVTQTVGTSAFGIPRVPDGHRPRHSALVYLKQVWPQILPIAQRFCRKPAQVPVLFGIALQRAIEQTQNALSPTLSASIAMECAVAMSKVALPGAYSDPGFTRLATVATPMPSPPSIRANPAPERTRPGRAEVSAPRLMALAARVPPSFRMITIVSLAFITVTGVMYESDPGDAPKLAREERRQESPKLPERLSVVEQFTPEAQVSQQQQPAEEQQQPAEEVVAQSAPPEEPLDYSMDEGRQLQLEPPDDGAEIVIPAEDLN